MVTVLDAHEPVIPMGIPEIVAPVAPVVAYVVVVIAVLIHFVCVPPAVKIMVLFGVTVIVPVAVIVPQPPFSVTVYVNAPETVGVPLMVTTLEAQEPVRPAGKPLIVAPVAPVVVYVVVVIAVLIHFVCVPPEVNAMVLSGVTVIVPVVLTAPQPPVRVTV